MKFGSITTGILSDGLVFNMDAANRASYIPYATQSFNTTDLSISGSLTNDTSYISPPTSASCWDYDGTDDIIAIGPEVDLGTTSTVSLWVKQERPTTGESFIGNNEAHNYLLHVDADDAVYIRFAAYVLTFNNAATKTALNTTDWVNITIVRTGLTTCYLYVNAVDNDGEKSNGSISANTKINTLGGEPDFTYDFQGQIANLQGYNRALSSNEVLHNYNALKSRFT